jgi:TonB family protein
VTQFDVRRCAFLTLAVISLVEVMALAQASGPRQPPASSRRLQGKDGDVIVVNGDDRLTVVRHREGNVRLVYDAEKRSLLLMTDVSGRSGNEPDGLVDAIHSFTDVTGEWPFGARWEGSASINEYSTGEGGRRSIVISTPAAVIELGPPMPRDYALVDPAPTVTMAFRGSSTRPRIGVPFDEAERHASDLGVKGGVRGNAGPAAGVVISGATFEGGSSSRPLRVGGNVRAPQKLFDVKPVYPQKARAASVVGTVILEITIGTDGAVTDVRVLRSIPLLDEAAVQAVRQWRYDVTMMNGQPVPVIMTVPVTFTGM